MKKIHAEALIQVRNYLHIMAKRKYRRKLEHVMLYTTGINERCEYGVYDQILFRLFFIYGRVNAFGYTTEEFLEQSDTLDPLSELLPWGSTIKKYWYDDNTISITSPGLALAAEREFDNQSGIGVAVVGNAASCLHAQATIVCREALASACEELHVIIPHVEEADL